MAVTKKHEISYDSVLKEVRMRFYVLMLQKCIERWEHHLMDADVLFRIKHMIHLRKNSLNEPFDFIDMIEDEIGNFVIGNSWKNLYKMGK